MKRKNNRNLLGVIALIAICAFMLISCPQQTSTLAKENPRALTLTYNGGSKSYYYLNNNWYSDKECKNVVEDQTLQSPAAQTATITVNFNEGTAQATGDEYFKKGSNSFTWNFEKYVKAGDESKADYFKDGLKLPENGILENVTLEAVYEEKEITLKLPSLVKADVTFGGYKRFNDTVAADTPITVTPGLIATYNAIWTQKTYKTLTLEIDGQTQNLYYGEDGAWYSALSEGGLLLDENKVTGDDVKFNIPSAPTWTVTFKKNPKSGMNDSEITITPDSVDVTPALTLTPGDLIDNTGKVSVDSIDGDKVVTGTYPPKAIGQSVIAESTNLNYAFEKWTVNGADIVDIANHQVNGNTEVFANWKNISDFKVLTVKDGDVVKDTVYYNIKDGKWYVSNITTSEEKTTVNLPEVQEKTYTLTLDYDNGSSNGNGGSVTSSFRGYGTDGNTSAVIGINGSLSVYTINEDTKLVSLWSEVKFTEPSEQLTKDGYVFDAWYKDGSPYDFNSVVTGDMTLTAHWRAKTYKTLTFDVTGLETPVATQKMYYGEDGAWYNALSEGGLLIDAKKVTGDNVKFNIPSAPTWTVTFNKNPISGMNDSKITFTPASVDVTPDLTLTPGDLIDNTGKVSVDSIDGDKVVTGTYSSKAAIRQDVKATTTQANYVFTGWTANGNTISDINNYEVSSNIEIQANWKYVSPWKKLTIKNELTDKVLETVYYNTADGMWYNENKTKIIRSLSCTPDDKLMVNFVIRFNYPVDTGQQATTYSGKQTTFKNSYGYNDYHTKIGADKSLQFCYIEKDTTLYALYNSVIPDVPSGTPSCSGYVFEGWWYKDGRYEVKYTPGTRIKSVTNEFGKKVIPTIYAKWRYNGG